MVWDGKLQKLSSTNPALIAEGHINRFLVIFERIGDNEISSTNPTLIAKDHMNIFHVTFARIFNDDLLFTVRTERSFQYKKKINVSKYLGESSFFFSFRLW